MYDDISYKKDSICRCCPFYMKYCCVMYIAENDNKKVAYLHRVGFVKKKQEFFCLQKNRNKL